MNSLISIIIPTRDRVDFVIRAIDSALGQSCKNIEIVVSDNSVKSETSDALTRYLADPRFKYIRQSGGLGMYENWNCAVKYASGKFLTILSDDDYLAPNFAEEAINAFNGDLGENTGVAIFGCEILSPDGGRLGVSMPASERVKSVQAIKSHFDGNFASYPCSIIYRKSDLAAVNFFDEEKFGLPADVAAWIKIALKRSFVFTSPTITSFYCLHGGNATLSSKLGATISGLRVIRDDVLQDLNQGDSSSLNDSFNYFESNIYLSLASLASQRQKFPAVAYLRQYAHGTKNLNIRPTPKQVAKYLFAAAMPKIYSRLKKFSAERHQK